MSGTFALQLSQFAEKAKENADKAVRGVALEVWGRLIYRSPVDTGRFRGNWQLTVNSPPAGTIAVSGTSESPAPPPPTPDLIPGQGISGPIYLGNNLPYAQRLEFGYSNQAPSGLVGITVLEFAGIVDQEAKKVNP